MGRKSSSDRQAAWNVINRLRWRPGPRVGAGDWTDPVWCVLNTTNDLIELMLVTVLNALHDDISPVITQKATQDGKAFPLYSGWERQFVLSVNEVYEGRTLRGYQDQPLSGKQLVQLYALYHRLAEELAAAMEFKEKENAGK